MLNKIFGITLSVVLALASQVAFAQNPETVAKLAEFAAPKAGATVAQLTSVFTSKTPAALEALIAANPQLEGAIVVALGQFVDGASAEEIADLNILVNGTSFNAVKKAIIDANIPNIKIDSSSLVRTANSGETSYQEQEVSYSVDADTKYIEAKNINVNEAKSLNIDGTQVTSGHRFNDIVSQFNRVMDVAISVTNPVAQENAVIAIVNYFEKTEAFSAMKPAGEKFVIATINADEALYSGVSNEITTANLKRYSDGSNQEALQCVMTGSL